jgi:hypothetical protein
LFWPIFPVLILHLLLYVCTQFCHLFLGHSLSLRPWGFIGYVTKY